MNNTALNLKLQLLQGRYNLACNTVDYIEDVSKAHPFTAPSDYELGYWRGVQVAYGQCIDIVKEEPVKKELINEELSEEEITDGKV